MATARSEFRCLLGSEIICLVSFDPHQTLLDFLRLEKGLTGTKEGCAEGDCGACTVLLGRLENSRIHYQPVNACIVPLGIIDSTQVLTVEHLADPEPHPVQQAMAQAHGSQCGFCTPGIVMSLAGLHYDCDAGHANPDHQTLSDTLAGNLCRCTGYGSIMSAAGTACVQPLPGQSRSLRSIAHRVLDEWGQDDTFLNMSGPLGSFAIPTDLETLWQTQRTYPDAQLIAGATDVGLWINKHHQRFESIINLSHVAELKRIEHTQNTLKIGATVTVAQGLEQMTNLAPDLGPLLRRFGSAQVRAQATFGGNIANGSPIGDLAPVLIALGATLHLVGPDHQRSIALEDFFVDYGKQDLAPGEIVHTISIPNDAFTQLQCWKISKRFDQDISAVCGAFCLHVTGGTIISARVAFGGMASTPQRARHCEEALVGQNADCTSLEPAAAALKHDFAPITDMRASASYRTDVARGLLERCLRTLGGDPLELLYPVSKAPGLSAHD